MKKKSEFLDRLDLSFVGIKHVLAKPRYMVFAGMTAFLLSVILYISINSGYYGSLFFATKLNMADKFGVAATMLSQMGQDIFKTLQGSVLFWVALLQGIAFAMILYNIRRNKRIDTSSMGKGGAAVLFATLGLGCVPCGTSLILPLLSLVFSSGTSLLAAANVASLIVMFMALGLSVYTLLRLGHIAIAHKAFEEISKDNIEEV